MKVKINEFFKIKNYFYYLQGTLRYKIYYKYKFLKFFVPDYIWKQIEIRINSIDKECYNNRACKMCGCSVTALQFANKACDGYCYPKMIKKKMFNHLYYSKGVEYIDEKGSIWEIKNNKFIRVFDNE